MDQQTIEKRPTRATPEMRQGAAIKLANDLISEHDFDAPAEDIAADIVRCSPSDYADGYELAKELDDRAHWDITLGIVEALDSWQWLLRQEIADAEKEWAARTSPQPPLPIGTRVRAANGVVGTITGIYEHQPAKFLVLEDGADESKSRFIINFEDVEALP